MYTKLGTDGIGKVVNEDKKKDRALGGTPALM